MSPGLVLAGALLALTQVSGSDADGRAVIAGLLFVAVAAARALDPPDNDPS